VLPSGFGSGDFAPDCGVGAGGTVWKTELDFDPAMKPPTPVA
jgi:hypothetical protein